MYNVEVAPAHVEASVVANFLEAVEQVGLAVGADKRQRVEHPAVVRAAGRDEEVEETVADRHAGGAGEAVDAHGAVGDTRMLGVGQELVEVRHRDRQRELHVGVGLLAGALGRDVGSDIVLGDGRCALLLGDGRCALLLGDGRCALLLAAGAAPFCRKPFMVSVKLSPTAAFCGAITPPAAGIKSRPTDPELRVRSRPRAHARRNCRSACESRPRRCARPPRRSYAMD